MATIEYVRDLVRRDNGLAVVVTQRGDGSPQASIANAGVLAHPVSGDAVVGLVVQGGTRKHANLRRRPWATSPKIGRASGSSPRAAAAGWRACGCRPAR